MSYPAVVVEIGDWGAQAPARAEFPVQNEEAARRARAVFEQHGRTRTPLEVQGLIVLALTQDEGISLVMLIRFLNFIQHGRIVSLTAWRLGSDRTEL